MTEEVWRPVVGWEGWYEVSSHGRVRSLDRERPNPLTGGVSVHTGRVIRPRVNRGGYLQVNLHRPGHRKTRPVHRLVAEALIPNPEGLPLVLHGLAGTRDNSVPNLRWGTTSDNMRDRIRDGTCRESSKTHCPEGHEYSSDNTRIESRGNRTQRRCRKCRAKQAQKLREKRLAAGLPRGDTRHGTLNGYNTYGCRCDRCRASNSEYSRRRKEKRQKEEVE